MNLGIALFRQGSLSEGVGHLEQALRLKPDDAEARRNLGIARFRLGEDLASRQQWDEAIRQYQQALEVTPANAQAYDALGAALSRLGRFAEAVQAAQQAAGLAEAAGQVEQAKVYRERLTHYQSGRLPPNRPASQP
jgi:superkiller protein 3